MQAINSLSVSAFEQTVETCTGRVGAVPNESV